MERQVKDREKLFVDHIADNMLIQYVEKNSLNSIMRKQPNIDGQKILADSSTNVEEIQIQDMQITHSDMKRCFTSLLIGKKQIKITVRGQ